MAINNTKGMKVEMTDSFKMAVLKLQAGRTDLVIDINSSRFKIPEDLRKTLYFSQIDTITQYHYINKKHAHLKDKLNYEIQKIKASSRYAQIIKDAEIEYTEYLKSKK